MSAYRVGDVIGHPAEPPLGATVEARDGVGPFRLTRGEDGWSLRGSVRTYSWRTVVDLWLPVIVVGLPGAVARCPGCGRWIGRGVVMCDVCIDNGR